MDNIKFFKAPKHIQADKIASFLEVVSDVFSIKGKRIPNIMFDTSNVETIDMLGVLVLYKFMEFVSKNDCTENPQIAWGDTLVESLNNYGFFILLNDYLRTKKADYGSLQFMEKGKFFIAPLPLLRSEDYSKDELAKKFYPQIERYYSDIPKASAMVFQCLSEVVINFWEHATDDTKSILVAEGSKDFVKIACADTGKGIISTLGPTLDKGYSKIDILYKSLENGVTSKQNTDHMGCGLWIIDELVARAKGKLYIYSEGVFYKREFRDRLASVCSYWKGTIIYIFLPLTSPATIADLEEHSITDFEEIKINTL